MYMQNADNTACSDTTVSNQICNTLLYPYIAADIWPSDWCMVMTYFRTAIVVRFTTMD